MIIADTTIQIAQVPAAVIVMNVVTVTVAVAAEEAATQAVFG